MTRSARAFLCSTIIATIVNAGCGGENDLAEEDVTAPVITNVQVDSLFVRDATISVKLSASEPVEAICFSETDSIDSCHWIAFDQNVPINIRLSDEDGEKRVRIWARDTAQNVSSPHEITLTLDTVAPVFKARIQQGHVVNTRTVYILAKGERPETLCAWEKTQKDTMTCGPTPLEWVLRDTDGPQTLLVQGQDHAGNESAPQELLTRLDRVPPAFEALTDPRRPAHPIIHVLHRGENEPIGRLCVSEVGVSTRPICGAPPVEFHLSDTDGRKDLSITAEDLTKNVSSPQPLQVVLDRLIVDLKQPKWAQMDRPLENLSRNVLIPKKTEFRADFETKGAQDFSFTTFSFRVVAANPDGPPWVVPDSVTAQNSPSFADENGGWQSVPAESDAFLVETTNPQSGMTHMFQTTLSRQGNILTANVSWDVPKGFVVDPTVYLMQFQVEVLAAGTATPIREFSQWAFTVASPPPSKPDCSLIGGDNTLTNFEPVTTSSLDPDHPDSPIVFTYAWTKMNAPPDANLLLSGSLEGTQSEAGGPWRTEIPGLPSNYFIKNDEISLSITATNTEQASVLSQCKITIGNIEPIIRPITKNGVTFVGDPEGPRPDSVLIAVPEFEVIDPDIVEGVDTPVVLFQWILNDRNISEATTRSLAPADFCANPNVSCTEPNKWDIGFRFVLAVAVHDGSDDSNSLFTSEIEILP